MESIDLCVLSSAWLEYDGEGVESWLQLNDMRKIPAINGIVRSQRFSFSGLFINISKGFWKRRELMVSLIEPNPMGILLVSKPLRHSLDGVFIIIDKDKSSG